MTAFVERILQISLSMAVVIGVLLLLVPLWQKHYSARWRKIIWLVIAVRLVIPFSPELPQTAVQLGMDLQAAPTWQSAQMSASGDKVMLEPMVPSAAGEMGRVSGYQGNPLEEKDFPAITGKPMSQPISRGVLFFAVWLGGMICFLLWHGAQYGFFRRKALTVAQPLEDSEELLRQAADGLQLRKMPAVAVSAAVQGPMLLGFAKPVILLPQRFYGEQELALILRHELMHHKLHDLWYKLVLLMANAVHWFNPLVWLMVGQAGRDVEQVCDEQVVRGQDIEYRKAYSMTILNAMASQRGVALSTYLSKQAQSSKKRFAAILYPQKYGKGVLMMAIVVLLAVAASGCLQIGKVHDGMDAYKQIAEFLPENAIQEPAVYEVREDENNDMVTYLWMEEPYTEIDEEADHVVIGWTDDDGKLHRPERALSITVSETDYRIMSYYYQRKEDALTAAEFSELGKSAEQREAYLRKVARKLIDSGDTREIMERNVQQTGQGESPSGYFTCGTMADDTWYTMKLNYQYGYLESFRYWTAADLQLADTVRRQVSVWKEGEEDVLTLGMNRLSGYYVLFTDPISFSGQYGGMQQNGAFCDRYVLQQAVGTAWGTYMQIGYEPDCTVEQWLASLDSDSRYAPRGGAGAWTATGEIKCFPEEPARQWQVFTAHGTDVINTCYVTAYRGGCMVVQLSMPSDYEEGWGSNMEAMLDTLALATETVG